MATLRKRRLSTMIGEPSLSERGLNLLQRDAEDGLESCKRIKLKMVRRSLDIIAVSREGIVP